MPTEALKHALGVLDRNGLSVASPRPTFLGKVSLLTDEELAKLRNALSVLSRSGTNRKLELDCQMAESELRRRAAINFVKELT